MKRPNLFIRHTAAVLLTCGLIAGLLPGLAAAQDPSTRGPRKIVPLSGPWQFATGSMDKMPDSFDTTVSVPGFHPKGEALWYRRTVRIDGPLPEVVRLEVKKVCYGVKVWVNGSEAGQSWSVRTPAFIDISSFMQGNGFNNEIVIRVCGNTDLIPPEIPWFNHHLFIGDLPTDFVKRETGIYDEVNLISCGAPYVLRAQAVPNVENSSVKLAVTLRNTGSTTTQVRLKARIIDDKTGVTVASGEKPLQAAAGESDTQIDVGVPDAKLWTPESPHLYRFEVDVHSGEKHTDTFADRFGMRTFSVCQETGRGLLNGQRILLTGIGMFQMRDVAGYFPDSLYDETAIRSAFRFVKSLNGNAVRISFDLMPEIWYRIADEEGILIQDESHWQINQGATVEAIAAELSDWIHERANHPCVVIWDAANESPHERHGGPRFREAIKAVRHLDLSNRPWEPSTWFPHTEEAPFYTQKADVTEWHPYTIWSYNQLNHSHMWFKKGMFYPDIFEHGPPKKPAGPGWIANECCGFFLRRDGSFFLVGDGPPDFAADFFAEANGNHYLFGRSRFVAWETEYYRRLPGCLGVLWVSYGWGAGIHQAMESRTFTERERALGRFVTSAAAPVGVMVDHWKSTLPTGKRKVAVSVANDGPSSWSGTVRLSLIRAGENLFKRGALFEPPETQAEIDQRTVHQWKLDLHEVPVSQQGEAVFDVVIPEAGNYHFMAEITGLDGQPVRSWRDFVSTGDPVDTPAPAARNSNNPRHAHSVAFPRPAGPEWSWGLPVYQIATRYYNGTGGFKEIEKDIPRLKSLHVGIIYLMPVHPCSEDTSRDAQMRGNNYQTVDYRAVNPAMGSLQDYKDLVKALHDNGMYVIQDMVPRHMHPGNNMLRLHPDWAKGKSWGLPAWNYDNPDAREYMLESLRYWIREVDIDGYRIDVAGSDPLPEVFKEFIPELRKIKPLFMLAEADGARFHPLYDMTYDWRNARTMIMDIVQKGGPASLIDENIRRDLAEYPDGALRMRHLDNHDFNVGMFPGGRVASNMDERFKGGQKAFAVLAATLPGKWMYFMGNEINSPRRIPHAWGKEYDWLRWPPEASDASEFTDLYTKLGAVHRYNPAVWGGSYRYLNTTRNDHLFVMERKRGNNVVLVVLNLSASPTTGTIDDALPEGDFTEAFTNETRPLSKDVDLPAWGYRVYVKDTPPRPSR